MTVLFLYLLIFLDMRRVHTFDKNCDASWRTFRSEGNLGQTADFPWLGVLRVHLHYETTSKLAITGIVLVKAGVALANAHDVARIPRRTFVEDSLAMFILRDQEPWYCSLREYITHPEYQYSTVNTIALVLLDIPDDGHFPVKPICWTEVSGDSDYSDYSGDSGENIFAIGYTDDNMVLEKFIYRMQPVSLDLCREFYTRAGLSEGMVEPAQYSCGFTVNNSNSCIWDNGMVLASNTTHRWTLIVNRPFARVVRARCECECGESGLGVHGPGCGAPARFLSLRRYRAWARAATASPALVPERRAEIEDIAYLFKYDPKSIPSGPLLYDRYLFETEHQGLIDINVTRINQSAISIHALDKDGHGRSHYGDCGSSQGYIMYSDSMKVMANRYRAWLRVDPNIEGTVVYKISMYDLTYNNITCVTVAVDSPEPETAYLFYKEKIETKSLFPYTPNDNLRYIINKNRAKDMMKYGNSTVWHPRPALRPYVIHEDPKSRDVVNINVYLTLKFRTRASLRVAIYGTKKDDLPGGRRSLIGKRRALIENNRVKYQATQKVHGRSLERSKIRENRENGASAEPDKVQYYEQITSSAPNVDICCSIYLAFIVYTCF